MNTKTENVAPAVNKCQCRFCSRILSRSDGRVRHEKTCKLRTVMPLTVAQTKQTKKTTPTKNVAPTKKAAPTKKEAKIKTPEVYVPNKSVENLTECVLDLVSIQPMTNAQTSAALGLQCGRIVDGKILHPDYITHKLLTNEKIKRIGLLYSSSASRTHNYTLDDLHARAQKYLLELLNSIVSYIFEHRAARNAHIARDLNIRSKNNWLSWALCSILVNQKIIKQTQPGGPYIIIIGDKPPSAQDAEKRTPAGVSKEQIVWLESLNIDGLVYGDNEHTIHNADKNKTYRVDGCDIKTNTVYEYHGCYFHGCPKCYRDPFAMNTKVGKLHGKLYEYTKEREGEILKMGYNLIVRWGCEK